MDQWLKFICRKLTILSVSHRFGPESVRDLSGDGLSSNDKVGLGYHRRI